MQEFKAESQKLLDLMISSIYTNHEVFLRELISNASDALDKVRLRQQSNSASKDSEEDNLGIHISYNKEARTLTVSDTGIGMSDAALEACLGTIAFSESQKVKEHLAKKGTSSDVDLIGQFGVGFYSAFMVAEHVTVVSRAQGSSKAYEWTSNGADGYTITASEREECGTDVILRIRPSSADTNYEKYLDQSSLQNLIKKYSNYIKYPITMDLAEESYDETGALVYDVEKVTRHIVNSRIPIWSLDEQEVSEADLAAFYTEEFGDTEEPLRVIRARARGAIEYDALMFIPKTAPAELYSKDYQYGLKLYSSGVLIEESFAALIPSHYRFVQGIIDTSNINLNISREMIQEDSRIQIIARQLERSIADNLKDMIEHDRDAYETFFKAYGTGLKFSICSSQGTLSEVLSHLLLYYSAREQRLISLQEYLDATENTKHTEIFYAVGSDVQRLAKNPNVNAVLELGHDVLLCPNGAQDELCFMLMGSYKGARFHSVTSSTLEIDHDNTTEGKQEEELSAETALVLQQLFLASPQPLIRVVASKYLSKPAQAAARIATEGLMTISMAKYIETQADAQHIDKPLYILEVNINHPLFALAEQAVNAHDDKMLKNLACVLLGQALLVEDIPLADPVAFNCATNALLARIAL